MHNSKKKRKGLRKIKRKSLSTLRTKVYKRAGSRHIGGGELKDNITLSILVWKSPMTIRNSLESYKKHNLFSMVKPVIYFQERDDAANKLANDYGIEEVLGTAENVGILNAFYNMVDSTTTPYFIFAECDFELINGEQKTKDILEDSIKLMKEDNVKLVRLRDRTKPGTPDGVRLSVPVGDADLLSYSYDNFEHKLGTLTFLKNPEEVMPNTFIIKGPPQYKYKWYICDFLCARWSNTIFIAETKFLKEIVLPYIKSHMNNEDKIHLLEIILFGEKSPLKQQLQAQGEGLFTHNRLDR
jgi:hypothetical protein